LLIAAVTIGGAAPHDALGSGRCVRWDAVSQGDAAGSTGGLWVNRVIAISRGRFVVSGGVAVGATSDRVAIFNPASNTWSPLGPSGWPREVFGTAFVPDPSGGPGRVYVTENSRLFEVNLATNQRREVPVTFFGLVKSIMPLSDGWLLLAGDGASFGSPSIAFGTARVNPATGAIAPAATSTGGWDIRSAIPLPDSGVLAAFRDGSGLFAAARFNPRTQQWERVLETFGGFADSVAYLPDGLIAIAGTFSSTGGHRNFTRYNPKTGVLVPTNNSGVSANAFGQAVLPNGDVLVTGRMQDGRAIGRWRAATNDWSMLPLSVPGTSVAVAFSQRPGAPAGQGWIMQAGLGGPAVVSGVAGSIAGDVFFADIDAQYWRPAGTGIGNGTTFPALAFMAADAGPVRAGDVLVGGDMTLVGGRTAARVAAWRPGTGTWSAAGSASNTVRAILPLADGRVLVVDGPADTATTGLGTLSRFDPASQVTTPLGQSAVGDTFLAGALLPDGRVLVGGQFSTVRTTRIENLAVYDPAANAWSPAGVGVTGVVRTLRTLRDGRVAVGGRFTFSDGSSDANLAIYTPSTNLLEPAAHTDGEIAALAQGPDGTLFFAGPFSEVSGQRSGGVAKLNLSTMRAKAVGPPLSPPPAINTLIVGRDGVPIVGGAFTGLGGSPGVARLARLNADASGWTPIGTHLLGAVDALAFSASGDLYVAGSFVRSGGTDTRTVARLTGYDCLADFDCSGSPTLDDIFAYLNAWFAGQPGVDADASGSVSVDDLFIFLSRWFDGC
jgi:hypothetical protein